MSWTQDQQLEYLLRLPWTVVAETTPEGDRILRIAEIPSATGSGHTTNDMERDLWDSLRESLRAYLNFGDPIPLPDGAKSPWVEAADNPPPPIPFVVRGSAAGATAGSHSLQELSREVAA